MPELHNRLPSFLQ